MKRRDKIPPNHDRWLVSYADFITLLFAFFVVLYATAQADKKKQADMAAVMQDAFGDLSLFKDPASKKKLPLLHQPAKDANIPNLSQFEVEMQRMLAQQIADHSVAIHMGRDGLVISLREAGFYDSGSASPKPKSLPVLKEIGTALNHAQYEMRIEGHTDNVPIHTGMYESNWELSAVRATRLTRLFIDSSGIAPERISAAGYAEFHPVADNSTQDGRSQNRRVDIIVLPKDGQTAKNMDKATRKILDFAAAAVPVDKHETQELNSRKTQ